MGVYEKVGWEGVLDVVVGFYERDEGAYYNSAAYLELPHRVVHVHRKVFLPTYGVFDEERYLARGRRVEAFRTRFGRAALLICEDFWHSITATIAALDGAEVIYVPSASPARGFQGGIPRTWPAGAPSPRRWRRSTGYMWWWRAWWGLRGEGDERGKPGGGAGRAGPGRGPPL